MNQMIIQTQKSSDKICHLDIDKFIQDWNFKYPYDRWWRKKYNVPFGSEIHRNASFIEMSFEYKEDMFYYKLKQKEEEDEDFKEIVGENTNQDKKVIKMSKKDLDNEFADLKLDDFNDK